MSSKLRERNRSSRSFAPRINKFSVRLRSDAVKRSEVQGATIRMPVRTGWL
jgi:hypothetical protein